MHNKHVLYNLSQLPANAITTTHFNMKKYLYYEVIEYLNNNVFIFPKHRCV